jgi:dephospho-CoA kinase
LRIGLTGGIASGKTTVAERFSELGVAVIDADAAARSVVAPGEPALTEIFRRFGPAVIAADGGLERRELRNLVFADPQARADLEGILHPRIRVEMERLAGAAGGPYLVMAIPLLVETAGRTPVDRVLVVDVPEHVQIERVMSRDACSADQARAIVAAQASRAERLARADDVLPNSGSIAELRRGVDGLHQHYLRLARGVYPLPGSASE